LTEAYLREVIPLAEYQRRRQDLEQKQHALAAQEGQLEAQVDRQGKLAGMVTSIEEFCQRVRSGLAQATFAQKRTLVELLIDRVLVDNGDVEIRYVIPTSPHGETTRFYQLRKDYFGSALYQQRPAGNASRIPLRSRGRAGCGHREHHGLVYARSRQFPKAH
jgi:site-specific DNA recombinase